MKDLNYSDIILEGYSDTVKRKSLHLYLLRYYHNAKVEYFEPQEFFDGCMQGVEDLEIILKRNVAQYKEQIQDTLDKVISQRGVYSKLSECEKFRKIAYLKEEIKKEMHQHDLKIRPVFNGGRDIKVGFKDINFLHKAILKAVEINKTATAEDAGKVAKFQYLRGQRILTKHHAITYFLDMMATGQTPPLGNKKKLEAIGRERLPSTSGNAFYQGCNDFGNIDFTDTINLIKHLGDDWRELILNLSKFATEVDLYFQKLKI